jgi:hypothetical protein
MFYRAATNLGRDHTTGEILNTNGKKLALRRQSSRTLTDSELRIAHGGAPSGARPSNDVHTSVNPSVNPSGGFVLHLPNGRVLNPSGGRKNPSGGSVDIPSGR